MTMQGPLTQWVTDHRKHHAFSDQPGDPHSPHAGHGDGALGAVRGFVHAHVGWLFSNLGMEQGREYGKDLYDNRLVRRIDRLYLLWVILTLGLPFLLGYWIGGTVEAGLAGLVWGGLIRIFAYQHATFSVNSICHMFGSQDYRSRDEARNNRLVAALVFGEGWHNNHHAFPASARHGLDSGQFDVSWWVIRGAERLGLVWDVKVPDAAQRERRRVQSRELSARRDAPTRGARERHRPSPVRAQRDPVQRARDELVAAGDAERACALEAAPRRGRRHAGDPGQPTVERAVQDVEPLPAQRLEREPVGDPRREPEHAARPTARPPSRSTRRRPSRSRAAAFVRVPTARTAARASSTHSSSRFHDLIR